MSKGGTNGHRPTTKGKNSAYGKCLNGTINTKKHN